MNTRHVALIVLACAAIGFLGCADKSAYNEAVTLQNSGQLDRAANAYQRFIKQFPKSKLVPKARKNLDYCESKLAYDRIHPRAMELFQNGRYDMAIEKLSEASKLCVKYPTLGDCQQVATRLATAKRHRVRQLTLDAENYERMGELVNALARYEEALPLAEDEEALTEIKVSIFNLTQQVAELRLKGSGDAPEAQKVYMGERTVTKRIVEEERKKEELEILTGRGDPVGPGEMPAGTSEQMRQLMELGLQMRNFPTPPPEARPQGLQ